MGHAITWHGVGTREIEAGVSDVALFPMGSSGYEKGVAWNGVTAINEAPSGADLTDLYADNIKYASMRAAEKFGFSIEAYTYPDEWGACDGSALAVKGVYFGQQPRKAFGLVYKSQIGDETHPGMDKGYKLHIIYNSTASPSSRGYTTINENPDAISFSWECNSTPVEVETEGTSLKPTCEIVIDSTTADATKLADLLDEIYGIAESEDSNGDPVPGVEPRLPDPDEVISIMTPSTT